MVATNGGGKGAVILEEQRCRKAVYQNQAGTGHPMHVVRVRVRSRHGLGAGCMALSLQ